MGEVTVSVDQVSDLTTHIVEFMALIPVAVLGFLLAIKGVMVLFGE